MGMKEKGLFARFLDFWKEKTEEGGAGIGFWSEKKTEKALAAEGMPEAQKETEKLTFWEKTVQRTAEQKAEEQGLFRREGRRIFSEEKKEKERKESLLQVMERDVREWKEPLLETAEQSAQAKKMPLPIFAAEIFREEAEWSTEKEKRKTIFLQETPLEEKEERKPVPIIATESRLAEETAAEEKEMPQQLQKEAKAEREQMPEIDIERLMQEMTKKLWEEREMSGRRLYG